MPLAKVVAERPDVFNHNVEVVAAPVSARPPRVEVPALAAGCCSNAKEMGGDAVTTKSGLMVGLGETHDELVETFGLLREHGVQVLTVGQYLRPTENHLPVVRYWHPDEFAALERDAYALGFEHVAAGPLVRLELPRRPARPAARAGDRPARRPGLTGRLRRAVRDRHHARRRSARARRPARRSPAPGTGPPTRRRPLPSSE